MNFIIGSLHPLLFLNNVGQSRLLTIIEIEGTIELSKINSI